MIYPPFFASEAEAARTYIACGRVALNWGPVEVGLEGILIRLRNRAGDSGEMWPGGWERKIRDIKDAIKKDIPARNAIYATITPLITEAKRLHAIRSNVVHCLCQGTNINGELMLGKSDQRRGVAYTQTTYTLDMIEQAADQMCELRPALDGVFITLKLLG